jgi:hypothetical protein
MPSGPSITVSGGHELRVTVTGYEDLGNGSWRVDVAITDLEVYEVDGEYYWDGSFEVEDAEGNRYDPTQVEGPDRDYIYGNETLEFSLFMEGLAADPAYVVFDDVNYIPLEEDQVD